MYCFKNIYKSMNLQFTVQRPFDISNRPQISIPDEDPYTMLECGDESSGSSGFGTSAGSASYVVRDHMIVPHQYQTRRSEKPPKLPPRDNLYAHNLPKVSKVKFYMKTQIITNHNNFFLFNNFYSLIMMISMMKVA